MEADQKKLLLSLLEFVTWVVGPDYEFVCFDVVDEEVHCSHVFNDYGGQPICRMSTGFVEKIVEEKKYLERDYVIHQLNWTDDGKPFRCSAFFIKDKFGVLTHVISVNFDQRRYENVMKEIVNLCHPNRFLSNAEYVMLELSGSGGKKNIRREDERPVYNGSINSLIRELAGAKRISTLSPADKRKIVNELKRQGVFDVKGSVKRVAEILYCSPSSIYRYLTQ